MRAQAQVRHAGWVFPRGKKDSVGKSPVLASIKNGALTLVKAVSLRGAIDLVGGTSVAAWPAGAADDHRLRLTFCTKSGSVRSITLKCGSAGERDAWVRALGDSVQVSVAQAAKLEQSGSPAGSASSLSSFDFDSVDAISASDELLRTSTSKSLAALVAAAAMGNGDGDAASATPRPMVSSRTDTGADVSAAAASAPAARAAPAAAPAAAKDAGDNSNRSDGGVYPSLTAVLHKSKSVKGKSNTKASGFLERIFCLTDGCLSYYSFTVIYAPVPMRRCRLELRERRTYTASNKMRRTSVTLPVRSEDSADADQEKEKKRKQKKRATEVRSASSPPAAAVADSLDSADQHWYELIVMLADDRRISLICGTKAQRGEWVARINAACAETRAFEEEEKTREVYVVAKAWMFKKGKSLWSGWKRRFFVFFSTRELWYYESENGSASVKGHIQLDKATEIRQTHISDAPQPHCFEIVTPARVWKVCPDVEEYEADAAVTRWLLLLQSSEAYERVQQRGGVRDSGMGGGCGDEAPQVGVDAGRGAGDGGDGAAAAGVIAAGGTKSGNDGVSAAGSVGSGQGEVTRTSAYQRLSGNVHVSLLSQSPWSAREIALGLMKSSD